MVLATNCATLGIAVDPMALYRERDRQAIVYLELVVDGRQMVEREAEKKAKAKK